MIPKNYCLALALLACIALEPAVSAQTTYLTPDGKTFYWEKESKKWIAGTPPEATPPSAGTNGARRGRITPPGLPVRITPAVTVPFAEDFESGQINTNLWDLRVGGAAAIKVEQDRVAHGKNALWVHYPAGTSRAWAFIAIHLPEALHDHLFGRAYMYVSGLPNSHNPLLMAGTPGFPIANFLEVGSQGGRFKPSFQQNGAGVLRGETTPPPQGEVPLRHWFCLEWEMNNQPDRIVLTVDGKQVADQPLTHFANHELKTDLVEEFSEFDIGFRTWAQPTLVPNDIDVYYDDIVISDKPIGQLTPVADAKP